MEKRDGRRGRRGRTGLVAIFLSVVLSVCLAVVLVCLELRHGAEMKIVLSRIHTLELEAAKLRTDLDEFRNTTEQLLSEHKLNQSTGRDKDREKPEYDDDYYYYDDEEEEEEEEEEEPHGAHNRTEPSGHKQRRFKRAISHKYNVLIEQNPKLGQYPSKPLEVQARIYVEKENEEGHRAQEGAPSTQIRHHNNNNRHYHGHGVTNRRTRVLVTEPNRFIPPTHPPRVYHEQVQGGSTSRQSLDGRLCMPAAIHLTQRREKDVAGHRAVDVELDEWSRADVHESPESFTFDTNNGSYITVRTPGIYYVYAQVYFWHTHDKCGFFIKKSGVRVAECTMTSPECGHHHGRSSGYRKNSCYTGRLVRVAAGEKLTIERHDDAGNMLRHEPEKSFFGLFRIS